MARNGKFHEQIAEFKGAVLTEIVNLKKESAKNAQHLAVLNDEHGKTRDTVLEMKASLRDQRRLTWAMVLALVGNLITTIVK